MSWVEPLELRTIVIQIFSGSTDIFTAVALFFIFGMSAYFRMNGLTMFFMVALFFIMFHAYVSSYFIVLIGLIGGLLIGYWISKIVKG